MTNYADRYRTPPTLTELEQARLLRTVGQHRDGFRDHVLLALALGAGLREHELVALDVGDVSADGRKPRSRILLRTFKGCGRVAGEIQTVPLATQLRHRLEVYLRRRGGELAAPLFPSRQSERLSGRMVRSLFHRWQRLAGFDQIHRFHSLRHTCATNVYRVNRDIREVMVILRHARADTSAIYTHPTEDDLAATLAKLAL